MATRSVHSNSTKTAARRNASSSAETSSPADRRKSPRIPHRATLTIRRILPDGVGAPIPMVLSDLSSGGMGALHATPLHVGDQYQVPLTREVDADPLSLICTIVRCEKMDDDLYSIGFEFNSSAAAVAEGSRQLIASAKSAAGSSSRRGNGSAASNN